MTVAQSVQSLARFFNKKAGSRYRGLYQKKSETPIKTSGQFRILIHCASHGEFEQVKPLIELIKKNYPSFYIIASFFSPSGYEMALNYEPLDERVYLPIDTPSQMNQFVISMRPDLVLLVKYEIWVNFIDQLVKRNIPIFLISGLFFKEQIFFKKYGGIMRAALAKLDGIFVQDEASLVHLKQLQFDGILAGDSRADRVIERKALQNKTPISFDRWKEDKLVLVLGSIWPSDWKQFESIWPSILEHYRVVIAPHEFDPSFLKKIEDRFGDDIILWSTKPIELDPDVLVLLLDEIGFLADVYQHADIAYIGGGFREGLHNVFEPAIYAVPVLYGPECKGHPEGIAMVNCGGSQAVGSSEALEKILIKWANDANSLNVAGNLARKFVIDTAGSSQKIYEMLKSSFFDQVSRTLS